MPPSATAFDPIAFDKVVAENLARSADGRPDAYRQLVDCVGRWIHAHAAALIAIAQEGRPAMFRALSETIAQTSDTATLTAVFHALPRRTVLFREFAIHLTLRLLDSLRNEALTPEILVLRSQLGARLREGGKPQEALAVLQELAESDAFASAPPLLQAHVLMNLGACVADLGFSRQSLQLHERAIALLELPGVLSQDDSPDLLAGQLVNAAAAALAVGAYPKAAAWIARAKDLIRGLGDRGLEFRADLVEFTVSAETHDFEKASRLGAILLPRLENFEEDRTDVYSAMLIDALVNVGSVALDEFQPEQAEPYFVRALELARTVLKQADSPQARWKWITTRLAVLTAKLQQNIAAITAETRELLKDSTDFLREHDSQYGREIHRRILEVVVRAATEDEGEMPLIEEIEGLINPAAASQPLRSEDPWMRIHQLHTAAMALVKLQQRVRALDVARQAMDLADALAENETIHMRAERAVLADSLSRRLQENGNKAEALDQAEQAVLLLELCWAERAEKYGPWMQRMFNRYRTLCEEWSAGDRFDAFCKSRLGDE